MPRYPNKASASFPVPVQALGGWGGGGLEDGIKVLVRQYDPYRVWAGKAGRAWVGQSEMGRQRELVEGTLH